MPKIPASASWQDGGILFITWDEAEGRNGDSPDQVPMIVVAPNLAKRGFTTSTAYRHASLFGLPRLGAAQRAQAMMEFFK